ncbi:uncharacterized protein L203_101874 [Cryptococcus depauperatus CBS 7841]|uniref:Nuclear pore complex protein Nup85 n=1 Tax=Cryptococcus depauperatus CBS 7841 TaxID=1295531 RepID=A0AAJ8M0K8_9TREE
MTIPISLQPHNTTRQHEPTKQASNNVDMDVDTTEPVETLYLKPEAYSRGDLAQWKSSGRYMKAALSPAGGEVAVWATRMPSEAASSKQPILSLSDETVSFVSLNSFPQPLVYLYTESHLLFTSLQQIFADSRSRFPSFGGAGAESWDKRGNLVGRQDLLGPPDAETVVNMRRLTDLYVDQLGDLKAQTDTDPTLRDQFSDAYNIINLAEILYLPVDGKGEGLVGEELLDWVNEVDIAPDNQLGNEIMSIQNPYDHPSFWPYITQSILRGFHLPAASFLRSISSHPYQPISKLAILLAQHLTLFPRSIESRWRVDLDFLQAHKRWLVKFRSEFQTWLSGKPRGKWFDDEYKRWEDDFRGIVELMEGKTERVLQEAGDWREALGAWGILVDVNLRRDHLPEIVGMILEKVPIDKELTDHIIQASLCSADIVKALMGTYILNPWLSAHLSDILDKLSLIPDDEEHFETSLRDYFLLEYAQMLQDSLQGKAFWRVVCDYLNGSGEEGRERLAEWLKRVYIPLEQDFKSNSDVDAFGQDEEGMDVEQTLETASGKDGEAVKLLEEVRSACFEFNLPDVWTDISQVLAKRLMHAGKFGMAATLALMGRDGWALARIAEKVMERFTIAGPEEYLNTVDTLPPTLLSEAPEALAQLQSTSIKATNFSSQSVMSVFASRITFLSEFRDYLLFLEQNARDNAAGKIVNLLTSEIAPVDFWAVLLVESIDLLEDSEILFNSNETFELMRVLQQVLDNASFAPQNYLGQLVHYLRRTEDLITSDGAEHPFGQTQKHIQQSSKQDKNERGIETAKRKMDEVRLALARNLARAMVVSVDSPF